MVRTFERLVDEPNVLLVELAASGLLGMWWDAPLPGIDPDTMIGGQFVEYARESPSLPALAALRAVQAIGVGENLRARAGEAADELADSGLEEPIWRDGIGHPTPTTCWQYRDGHHQNGIVLAEFEQQEKSHALVVFLEPLGKTGRATDISMTGDSAVLVRELRKKAMAGAGVHTLDHLAPAAAATLIMQALRRTDALDDPAVDKQYGQLRALAYARCRSLTDPISHVKS
ncbi:hypothetical protein GCM10009765_01560 [Fodinicola feengrottensis]|uniref:Uncharacterized protein n=2 Tax=Fodinicola feengrottensis TaxID=435914 RepID=A0ABN2FPQ6_9ACTN